MSVRFELAEDHSVVNFWHDCAGVDSLLPEHPEKFLIHKDRPRGLRLSGPPFWTLAKVSPLTIMPSIRCKLCGLHGYIRRGEWIPL